MTPTAEQLAAAKVLVEAATPGPWQSVGSYNNAGIPVADFFIPGHNSNAAVEMMGCDAVFIAASRTLVPELIAEVERLRAEVEENNATIDMYRRNFDRQADKVWNGR